MTNTQTIQNLSYESKLKELIKEKSYYNFVLKKDQTDEDLRNKFVNQLIEGIDCKYYEYLYELIDSKVDRIHLVLENSHKHTRAKGLNVLKLGIRTPSDDFAQELGQLSDSNLVDDKLNKYYSSSEINGTSLDDTLHEEVSRVVPKLFKSMRRFLKKSLDEELGLNSFELLETSHALDDVYHHLIFDQPLPPFNGDKDDYISDLYGFLSKGIEGTVYCKRLKRFDNKYFESNTYKELRDNYGGTVAEMMSSMYDLNGYRLFGQGICYYNCPHNLGKKFFSDFFASTLVEDEHNLELMKKHFPKSYKKAKVVFNKIMGTKKELLLK